MKIARVAKVIHNVKVRITKAVRLGGSSKLGSTPGGGVQAGPFNKYWSCSGPRIGIIGNSIFSAQHPIVKASSTEAL